MVVSHTVASAARGHTDRGNAAPPDPLTTTSRPGKNTTMSGAFEPATHRLQAELYLQSHRYPG